MWSLLHTAKTAHERYFSSLNVDTVAPLNITSTAGHTSSNTSCVTCTAQRSKLATRQLGLVLTPVERTFCLLYKPEGVSISKKKTEQDSRLHSHWICACHSFYDCYLIQIMNILSAGPRPCFSLLLWLLCSQLTTPAPRQTAVLLLGHWQAGGDGGSFHSCKDPLAFERKARQPHEIKRHSYLKGAFKDAVYFSGSTPNCSNVHSHH